MLDGVFMKSRVSYSFIHFCFFFRVTVGLQFLLFFFLYYCHIYVIQKQRSYQTFQHFLFPFVSTHPAHLDLHFYYLGIQAFHNTIVNYLLSIGKLISRLRFCRNVLKNTTPKEVCIESKIYIFAFVYILTIEMCTTVLQHVRECTEQNTCKNVLTQDFDLSDY